MEFFPPVLGLKHCFPTHCCHSLSAAWQVQQVDKINEKCNVKVKTIVGVHLQRSTGQGLEKVECF